MRPALATLPLILVHVAFAGRAAAAVPRDSFDDAEIEKLRAKSPRALALLEQGEAKVGEGSLSEAVALFHQARLEFPTSYLAMRRECEVYIDLGQRLQAVLACSDALSALASGNNVRAQVSAFIDGPTRPSTLDLTQAVTFVARRQGVTPAPALAAAACDIAERIGDNIMLQRCARDLDRLAPNDPATRRAHALLAARCPPWRFWSGWGAIATAILLTLVHALRRTFSRRAVRGGVAAVAAALSVAFSAAGTARAADAGAPAADQKPAAAAPRVDAAFHGLSKWPVDDVDPSSKIPTVQERNAEPLEFGYWLQDCIVKGEHDARRGDHLHAAKYYEALIKAVPDRATGYAKACEQYEAAGDIDKAIDFCAQSLLHEGLQVKDYAHFVNVMVSKPGDLTDKDKAALAGVLDHMRDDPNGRPWVDELSCEVATRTMDVDRLKQCVPALVAKAPNSPKTITYQWALAVADGHSDEADALLERAKAAGVAPEIIERMRKAGSQDSSRHALRIVLLVVGLGAVLAALVLGVRALLARLAAAPPAAPAEAPAGEPSAGSNGETTHEPAATEPAPHTGSEPSGQTEGLDHAQAGHDPHADVDVHPPDADA
jgi:tetratricopeptide (TPR) repeat protein